MSRYAEYRIQGVLAALQSLVIVSGCLFTAAALKVFGISDRIVQLPLRLAFIRNWGFLLILIPLAWVCVTIQLERKQSWWFTKRWTLVSGIILAGALGFYLFTAAVTAGNTLIGTSR